MAARDADQDGPARRCFERRIRVAASHPSVSDNTDYVNKAPMPGQQGYAVSRDGRAVPAPPLDLQCLAYASGRSSEPPGSSKATTIRSIKVTELFMFRSNTGRTHNCHPTRVAPAPGAAGRPKPQLRRPAQDAAHSPAASCSFRTRRSRSVSGDCLERASSRRNLSCRNRTPIARRPCQ